MISKGISKLGLVRKRNEDRFYTNNIFSIVADGMGGYAGGEKASTIAIDSLKVTLSQAHEESSISEQVLEESILLANKEVYEETLTHEELKGMGTTIVVAYVQDTTLFWANVGDSRLYIFRDNTLTQISRDHSIVQELYASTMSNDEIMHHPQRNVLTRAVGVRPSVEVDTGTIQVQPGDRILLCSDGLSGYVSHSTIEDMFQKEENNERLLDDLIDLVFNTGAKDNVTIVVGTI